MIKIPRTSNGGTHFWLDSLNPIARPNNQVTLGTQGRICVPASSQIATL
jgi:hypothetical protein